MENQITRMVNKSGSSRCEKMWKFIAVALVAIWIFALNNFACFNRSFVACAQLHSACMCASQGSAQKLILKHTRTNYSVQTASSEKMSD